MKLAYKKGFYNNKFEAMYAFGIIFRNLLNSVGNGFNFNGLDIVHMELVFSELYNNVSYSSVDGEGGVRFKDIKYSHPERWIFIDYDFTHPIWGGKYKTEKQLYDACKKMVGKKYDWLGIAGQAVGVSAIEDPNEFYCSEIVSYIQGINPFQVDPQKSYKINTNINKQIKTRKK